MNVQLLSPTGFTDYELIDSGNFQKLERFGRYVVSRPEPQAVWQPALAPEEWNKLANAVFNRSGTSEERGEWVQKPGMPDRWTVKYSCAGDVALTFRLALTSFKHVGLFPEQASNWDYIFNKTKLLPPSAPVLNLFAYTGGASLAAKAAGADVVHVDSVKQVVSWSRENMEHSGLTDVRWVVEDALKFVNREVKRGKKYAGIIMDPPAYGRGVNGEKWVLEENISELMTLCRELLLPRDAFLVLNLYSMGFSSLIAHNLLTDTFGPEVRPESGELYLTDRGGRNLPLGVFSRFSR